MAEETLALAMEMQWISQDDVTLEDYSWSIKTCLRATADLPDVHTAMEGFWSSLVGSGILNGATLRATRLNNWETSAGFTGWHMLNTKVQSIAGGGSSRLPTQLACVISFLNDTYTAVNIGRRRSRCYLGPCPASIFDGSGKITTGNITDIALAVETLQAALVAVDSTLASNIGINVVSPTESKSMHGTKYAIGRQMDTHRSRRQKAVEGHSYADLTF